MAAGTENDPYIMEKQPWVTLGRPVVSRPYGLPSKYEDNVQRRQSPGLTRTDQSSVSFAPLHSMFGIITPSGFHFERHYQDWVDIVPYKHRFMLIGMFKQPKIYTNVELMRFTSASRIPFIDF